MSVPSGDVWATRIPRGTTAIASSAPTSSPARSERADPPHAGETGCADVLLGPGGRLGGPAPVRAQGRETEPWGFKEAASATDDSKDAALAAAARRRRGRAAVESMD